MSRAAIAVAAIAIAIAPAVAAAQAAPPVVDDAPPAADDAPPVADDAAPVVTRDPGATAPLPPQPQPQPPPPIEDTAAAAGPIAAPAVSRAAGATAPPAQQRLTLSGYAQIDAVPWSQVSLDELDPATGDVLNETRILVRRARLRADYRDRDVAAAVEVDGNTVRGAAARLLAAHVRYRRPVAADTWFEVTAGLFKIPFGAEVVENERDRVFLEPSSAARGLFPGSYDAGVLVEGGWRHARLSLATSNGAPVADAQFAGRDPTVGVDVVGRAGVDVVSGEVRVRAGASLLVGTGLHPGTPATKDQIQWVDGNEDGIVQTPEIQVIAGRPALPSSTFERNALGGDVRVSWRLPSLGAGALLAEVVIATNLDRDRFYADPVAASRDLRELGWHLGVIQGVRPWLDLGARYDRYQPDRDASEVRGASLVPIDTGVATLAILAAVRRDGARLTAEYDHERNPFGRSDDGAPMTLAADRITVRAHVEF